MSLNLNSESVGGYGGMGFGGGSGIGGLGLVGLIGLNSLGRGLGGDDIGRRDTPGTTVLEQNVSDLRKDVADTSVTVERLGNEMQQAFATQNLAFSGEFRNLDNQICEVEKEALKAAHANEVQGLRNTISIKDQLTAFETSNDKQFCEVKNLIQADGALTRGLINTNLIDDLRAQLASTVRGRDNREIEINVQNNATQTQNQIQQQAQFQTQQLANLIHGLGEQVNRATNSVINVGSGLVAAPQTQTQANTKVNS